MACGFARGYFGTGELTDRAPHHLFRVGQRHRPTAKTRTDVADENGSSSSPRRMWWRATSAMKAPAATRISSMRGRPGNRKKFAVTAKGRGRSYGLHRLLVSSRAEGLETHRQLPSATRRQMVARALFVQRKFRRLEWPSATQSTLRPPVDSAGRWQMAGDHRGQLQPRRHRQGKPARPVCGRGKRSLLPFQWRLRARLRQVWREVYAISRPAIWAVAPPEINWL